MTPLACNPRSDQRDQESSICQQHTTTAWRAARLSPAPPPSVGISASRNGPRAHAQSCRSRGLTIPSEHSTDFRSISRTNDREEMLPSPSSSGPRFSSRSRRPAAATTTAGHGLGPGRLLLLHMLAACLLLVVPAQAFVGTAPAASWSQTLAQQSTRVASSSTRRSLSNDYYGRSFQRASWWSWSAPSYDL